MTAYQPNFSDPRVKSRAIKALEFVDRIRGRDHQWLSSREIQRHMGSMSRPLGKYLKSLLLTCTDSYYNMQTGRCQRYRVNAAGFNELRQRLHLPEIVITDQNLEELATGDFQYKTQGHRDYHRLQNIPRRLKKPLLARHGYRHEYDIRCAAHTLILQRARSLGFSRKTPLLDQYISDRTSVRRDLSERLGISTEVVKKILTAILKGAKISAWHDNHIFSYVEYNRLMIEHLRDDAWIKQYQKEVSAMWRSVRKSMTLGFKERFTSKMKSEIYRSLEQSVREVVKTHVRKDKNKVFFEHDGWSTEKAIDTVRLIWEVKKHTGFVIELDWTIHEYVVAS